MRFVVAMLVVLPACNSDKDGTTDPTDDTDDDPTVETADTAGEAYLDLTGNAGSIVVGYFPADAFYGESWYAAGVFLDDDGGVANLAACVFVSGECISEYPAVDAEVSGLEDVDFLAAATFYDVGGTVDAGDVALRYDATGYFPAYFGTPTGAPSTFGLTLDGDYAPYAGTSDFAFPDPIVVTSPDPLAPIEVTAGSVVDLEWASPGEGGVYLEIASADPSAPDRVLQLADDGSYSLSVDELGFTAPFDTKVVYLSRILNSTVDAAGNEIEIQTRSDQWLYLNYTDTTGWTELAADTVMGETCADATLLAPVGPGQYYGDLSAFDDDHDLGDGNPLTGFATVGEDGVFPVVLTAGQSITAEFVDIVNDGAIYLLDASCDPSAALAASDAYYYGQSETLQYTATVDGTYYVVLDGFYSGYGNLFTVLLDIQ